MSIHASKRWIVVGACQDFAGNEPPFGKILAYDTKIEGVYLSATGAHLNGTTFVPGEDKFVTPAMMTRVRSFGLLAGGHFVPRSADAISEARKAADMVTALNPDCVMLDIETHDLSFQRGFVAEYRRLKPGRATDVTFEPRQDGSTVSWPEYIDARFDLFPQLFRGDMRPADAKRELRYWSMMVGWDRVHLVYGAGLDWWRLDEGAIFDAETLPDKRTALARFTTRSWNTRGVHSVLAKSCTPVQPCGEETQEKAA